MIESFTDAFPFQSILLYVGFMVALSLGLWIYNQIKKYIK